MKNSFPELCELAKGPKPKNYLQTERKQKVCKVKTCKQKYTPKGMELFCSIGCGVALGLQHLGEAERKRAKREQEERTRVRKEIQRRRADIQPLSYWLNKAQKAVNALRREIDRDKPCFTCKTRRAAQWDAGHFISRGASSALRFDYVRNIRKQCSVCNDHNAGRLREFRSELVGELGEGGVAALENAPRMRKWTREEAQAIEADAKSKLKALKESTCE